MNKDDHQLISVEIPKKDYAWVKQKGFSHAVVYRMGVDSLQEGFSSRAALRSFVDDELRSFSKLLSSFRGRISLLEQEVYEKKGEEKE